ncbi:MAG: nucleotidyl transferase AbiEii/AbiGii toxin family protein [Tannerella sp.]|jgi:hypothetical protein|nr:nucleotidyl transferase AbiEii/AbiGii toxin family protein [Tannerella sp.]
MHLEIFSENQKELLPALAQFSRSFYLVGGTAIALQIGHRQSIDFDLFSFSRLNKSRIKNKISKIPFKKILLSEDVDQIHLNINGIKVTFFNYPYKIEHPIKIENRLSMPNLLTLASMKAFTLGRRAKWKDYVDLYFFIRDHFSINEISQNTSAIFGQLFSERLFREQLVYHADIDYSEEVVYMSGFEKDESAIKNFLIDKALEW